MVANKDFGVQNPKTKNCQPAMSNYGLLVPGSTADSWALTSTIHNPVALSDLADFGSPIRVLLGLHDSWPASISRGNSKKRMRKHISHPSQSADLGTGRANHRRQLKQRRRLVDAAYVGGGWRRRPEKKSWDWRGSTSQATAVREANRQSIRSPQDDISDSILAEPSKPSRYYRESIDLREDSILSDELLEALNKPLSGSPIRPQHALAANRLTSRPAGSSPVRRSRVRKISVR